mmetsp:Transcript_2110/g.6267  ORF Transcript_2110/g.6267 Transcript_2110/m.6267 type:complete len:341 (+) Transcript_2110:412-1434(+)
MLGQDPGCRLRPRRAMKKTAWPGSQPRLHLWRPALGGSLCRGGVKRLGRQGGCVAGGLGGQASKLCVLPLELRLERRQLLLLLRQAALQPRHLHLPGRQPLNRLRPRLSGPPCQLLLQVSNLPVLGGDGGLHVSYPFVQRLGVLRWGLLVRLVYDGWVIGIDGGAVARALVIGAHHADAGLWQLADTQHVGQRQEDEHEDQRRHLQPEPGILKAPACVDSPGRAGDGAGKHADSDDGADAAEEAQHGDTLGEGQEVILDSERVKDEHLQSYKAQQHHEGEGGPVEPPDGVVCRAAPGAGKARYDIVRLVKLGVVACDGPWVKDVVLCTLPTPHALGGLIV